MRQRYVANGEMTHHFEHLHLRANDKRPLLETVLRGHEEPDVDAVTAILIIIYRFRNNLLHGQKWAYGIKGQLGNFTHANAVLMKALEIEGP